MSQVHVFGIRHHGPGCARSLVAALESLAPDCLLVEGPPEGNGLIGFAAESEMAPPVALLAYCPDRPELASYYPFAEYSPEWQALRYALRRDLPFRFIDLPCALRFALRETEPAVAEAADQDKDKEAGDETAVPANPQESPAEPAGLVGDPLEALAQAAGYADSDLWWSALIEERGDGEDVFQAIREAMTAVREAAEAEGLHRPDAALETLREAHMRQRIREAGKEGYQRIAVICGAWHLPALERPGSAKADQALLKGLAKVRVEVFWVPWSNGNLSRASGYGAGIAAPGWYEHLWRHPDRAAGLVPWLAKAARLFRDEDIDCSSAHVIEAARLAESLAALRDRPRAGLAEIDEALLAVVCLGDSTPLKLIRRRLAIGERLGRVPDSVPALPFQRDLEREQKRLRLKPEAFQRSLDLDLREATDLARSQLLHRLTLLDIPWGTLAGSGSGKGTFREVWNLQWRPELALPVVEAGRWGTTVAEAARRRVEDRVAAEETLAGLAGLVQAVLLADLREAVEPLARALYNRAAVANDAAQLLDALPPLANILRYGNVRKTDLGAVRTVFDGLVLRAAIGLPGASQSLDDDAAAALRAKVLAGHAAIALVAEGDPKAAWLAALGQLAHVGSTHGLLSGLAARLRFDEQADSADTTADRLSQALSVGTEPTQAAAWLEGFLNRSGMILLHDARLWSLVDAWVGALAEDYFIQVLPLVRRAFSALNPHERRQIGEKARSAGALAGPARPAAGALDWERAARPVPLLRALLGLPNADESTSAPPI